MNPQYFSSRYGLFIHSSSRLLCPVNVAARKTAVNLGEQRGREDGTDTLKIVHVVRGADGSGVVGVLVDDDQGAGVVAAEGLERRGIVAGRRGVYLPVDAAQGEEGALLRAQGALDRGVGVGEAAEDAGLELEAEVHLPVEDEEELVGAGVDVWGEDTAGTKGQEVERET
jgi:hypothetical protein